MTTPLVGYLTASVCTDCRSRAAAKGDTLCEECRAFVKRMDAQAAQEEAQGEGLDLTAYERRKMQQGADVSALVKGRLAATARGQAKARAIPSSEPKVEDDAETVDELLRQRGTGSVGAKVINQEEG